MFKVDPKSLAALQRKLERDFPRTAGKEGRALIKRAALELKNKVRAAAPIETGELRRAIYVKVLRDKFGEPHAADVRVRTSNFREQVRVALKGAKKKADGFYWRFIEFGTKKMPARPFVAPTVEKFKPTLERYFKEYRDLLAEKFNRE